MLVSRITAWWLSVRLRTLAVKLPATAILAWLLTVTSAQAPNSQKLIVLTKPIAPFVMQNSDGRLSGFSIELWDALAARMDRQTEYRYLPDLKSLLADIQAGRGDAAIAAISITADREAVLDFSYPYFDSGLQIMTVSAEVGTLQKTWSAIKLLVATHGFRSALFTLALLLLIFAHVIWWIERDRNPAFSRSYPAGLWDAVYWALVTVTTVGYGDKTPKSSLGQVVALVLIFFGYLTFAWFTATVASSLTVSQLEGAVLGPGDLAGKRVATVAGSTGEQFLRHLPQVNVLSFALIDDAFPALLEGKVDAIIYDFPSLSYFAQHEGKGKVRLVGPVFQREPYGIAFPQGSPLREQVNRALLEIRESGLYDRIYSKWFGASE